MKSSQQNGIAAKAGQLISLSSLSGHPAPSPVKTNARILLLKPPYFTPWTPPLGIAILKAFLGQHGYSVTCFDFNIDPDLWGMHHKYFSALQDYDRTILNDGYSKLWWVLNAHILAFVNRASRAEIAGMLDTILPIYGIRASSSVAASLLSLVENYFTRLDELADGINFSSYDVVGTSTYTTSLGSSLWLLRKAKEQSSAIKTVIGGGAFADDLAIGSDNLEILLRDYQFIDHVVLGEGEMLFLQLLNGTLAGKRLISLPDLNGARLEMKDVPAPDFSDLDLENYYHLTIEGARSCPFQCSFCSETIQWGEYRKKPFDLLAEQVVELSRNYGIREFFMGDSLMNPYLIPFASELLKREANILYDGYLRADRPVTNRKFVSAWAASGLFRVRLGIESAAPNVLKTMDKKTTPEVIAEVLKTLATMGIRTTTYWIVGFGGETEADFEETCEFIRKHHQYIYELEAHPYYYYPYGQVGSRLHPCKELYPEQVTALTHFKVWEIIDANPTREVRYQRLKRICALASELGIPNIYTMAERYAAEDRWRTLHPAAIEVYPGTHTEREPAVFVAEAPVLSNAIVSQAGEVVAFHCAVSKPLERGLLIKAFAKLFEYHQVLRMRLDAGRYVSATHNDEVFTASVRDLDCLSEQSCRNLSADMTPDKGLPLRLGVLGSEGSTDLLLCGHRGIIDPASLACLTEDLFRIYEQLANGKKVSFPKTGKSYSEAASMLPASSGSQRIPQETASVLRLEHPSSVLVEHSLITPTLLAGIIQSASSAVAAAGLSSFAVLVDPRAFEPELTGVIGALSRLSLCASDKHSANLDEWTETTKSELKRHLTCETGSGNFSPVRVLINLEFLLKTPWLGGDTWKPQGFVLGPAAHPSRFDVELLTVAVPEGIQIQVLHQDNPGSYELARQIASRFIAEMSSMVEYRRQVREAERFWCAEFGPPYQEIKKLPDSVSVEAMEVLSAVDCGFGDLAPSPAESVASDFVSLLAACVIVLARSVGQNFVDIAVKHPSSSSQLLPLRLTVQNQAKFEQFRASVQESLELALKHGQYSKAVLRRFTTPEVVRFGFIVTSEQDRASDVRTSILENGLEAAWVLDSGRQPGLRLIYKTSFGAEYAASLSSWLNTLLRNIAENENAQLEDLLLAPGISDAIAVETQAPELEESFQF